MILTKTDQNFASISREIAKRLVDVERGAFLLLGISDEKITLQ